MADYILASDALARAEVRTGEVTGYDVATTYTVSLNGKEISSLGTGGSVTTTAAALVSLLNASTIPEFAEITWSNSSGSLIATCDTAGKTVVPVLSKSGGTGTITDFSVTTAARGPAVLSADNVKSTAGVRALPTNGDNLTIEDNDVDLFYALEALSAVTLTNLHIEASMLGVIGLTSSAEYRPRYFKMGATNAWVGSGSGDGSPRLMLDFGTVETALTVLSTGSSDDDLHALIVKGTHTDNALNVESGSVDIAPFGGEVATLLTLTAVGDSIVRTSKGVTLGTVVAGGSANVTIDSATGLTDTTLIEIYDSATVTIYGDNVHASIKVYGPNARLIYNGSGNITALDLVNGGTIDAANNPNEFTVVTLTGSGTPSVIDPNNRMAVTNAVDPSGSDVFAWNWNIKPGRAITLGAP